MTPTPAYLMHIHRNQCSFCHTEERWSQIYRCDDVEGAKYPKLHSVTSVPDLAPMGIIHLPINTISICARCAPGRDTVRDFKTYSEWRDTLLRKAEAARQATLQAAREAREASRPRDISDLL